MSETPTERRLREMADETRRQSSMPAALTRYAMLVTYVSDADAIDAGREAIALLGRLVHPRTGILARSSYPVVAEIKALLARCEQEG